MEYPFLTNQEIECRAATILFEYEQKHNTQITDSVPIEDLIENHLGLAIYPAEEQEGVLGYIDIYNKAIYINEKLYPDDIGYKNGRYNFTLGHELGHWDLHAPIIKQYEQTYSLLEEEKVILCRTNDSKIMIEKQADYYAASLLMPKSLIRQYWNLRTGNNNKPLLAIRVAESITCRMRENKKVTEFIALQMWAKDLAQAFNVSPQAMVIRLKNLGWLIEDDKNHSLF